MVQKIKCNKQYPYYCMNPDHQHWQLYYNGTCYCWQNGANPNETRDHARKVAIDCAMKDTISLQKKSIIIKNIKYRLLKPLPWIEVGTIYDTNVNGVTKQDIDLEFFVRNFWTDNDFFEPIKESKYWEPEEGEYYSDIGGEYGKNLWYDCDDVNISTWLAFKTKEEAEKQLKLMQAITRCKRYLVENDMLLSDSYWKTYLYTIMYNQYTCEICVDWFPYIIYSPYGHINSRENAKKFMKDCEEDLKLIHLPS